MAFLYIALLIATVGARDIRLEFAAAPTELEYEFCKNSPEPGSIDMLTVEPFPIKIVTGGDITIAAQITLTEEMPAGATADVKFVKEGIINIPLPCLDVGGFMVGSCSYDMDTFLAALNTTTPLLPGVYGGEEPLTVTLGEVPNNAGGQLGTIRAEVTIKTADGDKWTCISIRAKFTN